MHSKCRPCLVVLSPVDSRPRFPPLLSLITRSRHKPRAAECSRPSVDSGDGSYELCDPGGKLMFQYLHFPTGHTVAVTRAPMVLV